MARRCQGDKHLAGKRNDPCQSANSREGSNCRIGKPKICHFGHSNLNTLQGIPREGTELGPGGAKSSVNETSNATALGLAGKKSLDLPRKGGNWTEYPMEKRQTLLYGNRWKYRICMDDLSGQIRDLTRLFDIIHFLTPSWRSASPTRFEEEPPFPVLFIIHQGRNNACSNNPPAREPSLKGPHSLREDSNPISAQGRRFGNGNGVRSLPST
jgi:hypothetical protein